ncbi:hypothetical protein [Planomicrobium sp. CPCC 101110]|uniref:hypothetical protein n=1 Tax=Planomicrobium sp. CPCC 101110 TaxID=2599619 RepID=UPI0011B5903A|nr:hypothetical protein [Planomicrobium sp. CPCC 101110]TWT27670.1 hypothetical protein FQV30_03910 [Planomicrobium sp. CPCC 101110]
MRSSYVLEIPDLDYVLDYEDVRRWEVFLLQASKRYEKIAWQASSSEKSGTLQQLLVFYGRLKAAEIDFQNKRIVFFQGVVDQGEFGEFLLEMLDNMFIRIRKDQMHFVVSPKYLGCQKRSIMR